MMSLTCAIARAASAVAELDRADLAGDLFGGARGLAGKRFHFGSDHRKAAPGVAGAGRFDRRIERQQIGLPGDRLKSD